MDIIKCAHCGAEYERKYHRVTMRDKGTEHCSICGSTIDYWDGASVPSYRLVSKNATQPG